MGGIKGFTLTELLVTLSIAALILTIGVPSFQTYIQNARITTGINYLVASLNYARAEALTRQQFITACKSNDGSTCHTGTGSGDWSQGWIVFADVNKNGTRENTEELIRVAGSVKGVSSFIGNNNVVNRITFTSIGITTTPGTVTLCDSRGVGNAAAVIIGFSGRIKLATDTNGNNVVDDGEQPTPSDVTCA